MNILKHDSPIQSLTPKSESEIVIEEMHVYQDSESLEEDKTKCHDIVLTNKIKPSEAAVIEYSEKMQRPIIRKYGCSNRKKKGQFKIKKEFKECAGKQMFDKKWLKVPKFQDWLKEGLMPYEAFCTACNVILKAGKTKITAHSKSKKHIKNLLINENKIIEPDLTARAHDITKRSLMRVIDLRCDSLSIPSREMRYAMIEATVGDTSFNSDTAVLEFEKYVAQFLNMECGLFFPTHDMANLVAVLAHCQSRGSAVIAGDASDISLRNKEALVKFGGLHFRTVKNKDDGTFSMEDLEAFLRVIDNTFPLSCVVCYECPHTRMGGKIPSQEWIDQLRAIRGTSNILLHCDGSRLINASMSQSLPASVFVKDCDSVTLAIDKALGAPLGAVLVGAEIFIQRAKSIRDSIGGHIHQAGTFASAGKYAFDHHFSTVDSDHNHANAIAIGIARENSLLLSVEPVQTNIVHVHCKNNDLSAIQLQKKLSSVSGVDIDGDAEEKEQIQVLCNLVNDHTVSLMIHNQLTHSDVKAVIQKFVDIIEELDTLREI